VLTDIPGYRLVRVIGQGGMGEVHEAQAHDGSGRFAVKVIRREFADDPEYRRLFEQEARRARSVTHPGVVEVVDGGEHDGHLYLVMRYVDGNTLAYFVDRFDRMSPAKAIEIIGRVAEALDAVHDAGLVHGDVSPANVILAGSRTDPRPLLTDFGLARPLTTAGLSASDTWARSGRGLGTPGFMAPEKIAGDRLTRQADVYSLCALLYFVLLGEPPHAGMPRLSRQRDDLPAAIDRVTGRALMSDPQDRYATATEFARALKQAVRSRPSRRPRIALVGAATVLLVAAGAVSSWTLLADDKDRPHGPTPATPSGQAHAAPSPSPSSHRPKAPAHRATSAAPKASPSRTPSPTEPTQPTQPVPPTPVASRRVVCAYDLEVRDAHDKPIGRKLYRGDVVAVHGHSASGWLAQITDARGRPGWVEAKWLGATLNDCPK
jgi:serine/threonine protein kinase